MRSISSTRGKRFTRRYRRSVQFRFGDFAYRKNISFRADLEAYHFALLPVAFETPLGTLKTVFAENAKGAAGRLAKLLCRAEFRAFPFDPMKPYNVGVRLNFASFANCTLDAVNVKVDPGNPNAIPVTLAEEDILKRYPWTYHDLLRETKKKLPDLKFNSAFNKVMASCEKRLIPLTQGDL